MIALARRNAKKHNFRPPHVAFVQTLLTEPLPILSNSIDCIISNCVINLIPMAKKSTLLNEAYRVLKPGGRIVFEDVSFANVASFLRSNYLLLLRLR